MADGVVNNVSENGGSNGKTAAESPSQQLNRRVGLLPFCFRSLPSARREVMRYMDSMNNTGTRQYITLPEKLEAIGDQLDRLAPSGRGYYEQQAVWGVASMVYETADEIAYRRRKRRSRSVSDEARREQFEIDRLDWGLAD